MTQQVTIYKGKQADTFDFSNPIEAQSFFHELCDQHNIPDEDISKTPQQWETTFIGHDVIIVFTKIQIP